MKITNNAVVKISYTLEEVESILVDYVKKTHGYEGEYSISFYALVCQMMQLSDRKEQPNLVITVTKDLS